MKTSLIAVLLMLAGSLAVAQPAHAQSGTPIIVGPNSVLAWEVTTPDIATARLLVIAATVDGTALPAPLTPISCGPGPAGSPATTFTCSSPLSQVPIGSHSVTITASLSGATSLPSTPFAYIDMLIPVPQNLRAK